MDVRLTAEQRQLRDAAARLADELGPGSVADLDDEQRVARLDKAVETAGWRSLRSDGASGVEVALVAEEFGRGLVDVAFLGPVLADDLLGAGGEPGEWTVAVDGRAVDARGRDPRSSHGPRPRPDPLAGPDSAARAQRPRPAGRCGRRRGAGCLFRRRHAAVDTSPPLSRHGDQSVAE